MMAMVNASSSIAIQPCQYPPKVSSFSSSSRISSAFLDNGVTSSFNKRVLLKASYSCNTENSQNLQIGSEDDEEDEVEEHDESRNEMMLYSFSPLPLMVVAALPGASTVRSLFAPFVELVKSFDLPGWLVHWGHPGNMAVVLFAMGGYGTYLGFRIRFSDDVEEKAMAKDLHPKLLAGMFFFFALGATGGVTSLLTSDKPIFESPHAVTGLIGLALLTIQTLLPTLFEVIPQSRVVFLLSVDGNKFGTSYIGKSWFEECPWDTRKWDYDPLSCSRGSWTPARFELLIDHEHRNLQDGQQSWKTGKPHSSGQKSMRELITLSAEV